MQHAILNAIHPLTTESGGKGEVMSNPETSAGFANFMPGDSTESTVESKVKFTVESTVAGEPTVTDNGHSTPADLGDMFDAQGRVLATQPHTQTHSLRHFGTDFSAFDLLGAQPSDTAQAGAAQAGGDGSEIHLDSDGLHISDLGKNRIPSEMPPATLYGTPVKSLPAEAAEPLAPRSVQGRVPESTPVSIMADPVLARGQMVPNTVAVSTLHPAQAPHGLSNIPSDVPPDVVGNSSNPAPSVKESIGAGAGPSIPPSKTGMTLNHTVPAQPIQPVPVTQSGQAVQPAQPVPAAQPGQTAQPTQAILPTTPDARTTENARAQSTPANPLAANPEPRTGPENAGFRQTQTTQAQPNLNEYRVQGEIPAIPSKKPAEGPANTISPEAISAAQTQITMRAISQNIAAAEPLAHMPIKLGAHIPLQQATFKMKPTAGPPPSPGDVLVSEQVPQTGPDTWRNQPPTAAITAPDHIAPKSSSTGSTPQTFMAEAGLAAPTQNLTTHTPLFTPLPILDGISSDAHLLRQEPALARNIAAQIAEISQPTPNRPVDLALNPEELGKIRLTFTAENGALTVSVTAERPETLELMRRHIDTLAQDLRNAGYKDVSFGFEQDGAKADSSLSQQSASTDDPAAASDFDDPDTEQDAILNSEIPPHPATNPGSGIDIRL